jgi:hypothetical protein
MWRLPAATIMSAACHRLVTVWWARSCNPMQNRCPGPGGGDRPLGGAELPEAYRVFNGSLVDRVEKLSEKLNEIISAKRG